MVPGVIIKFVVDTANVNEKALYLLITQLGNYNSLV